MTTSVLALALLFTSVAGSRERPDPGPLRVEVTHVREAEGAILVALFDNENDFLKKAVKWQTVKAHQGNVLVVVTGLAPGRYAISVVHDKNENGTLDFNRLGIPREGFGFGNNATGVFGPPAFEKTVVEYTGDDATTAIRMKYL